MKNKFIYFSIVSIIFSGCSHYIREKDLNSLYLGMTKEEVTATLKGSGITRGASIIEGTATEGVQYKSWTPFSEPEDYFLYFEDGKLTQWGRPQDWHNNTRKYEVNVGTK